MSEPPVSRETEERLAIYVALLGRWAPRINLIARSTTDSIRERHVADCLQLDGYAPADAARWVDLGSGAGLPGLVIAACRPTVRMVLVESDGKKCAFLRAAAREMGLDGVEIVADRIEAAVPGLARQPVSVVSARALAPLPRLLAWAAPLLRSGAIGLFPKGKTHAAELTLALESWHVGAEALPSRTDADAAVIRITDFHGPREDG